MNRRIMLAVAAVLAIGACNDQQEPNTGANPGQSRRQQRHQADQRITKTPATAAQPSQLGKYAKVVSEIRELKAVLMSGKESSLATIRALPFVVAANFDAERNIPPFQQVSVTDFTTAGLNTWDLDAVNVTNPPTPVPGNDRVVPFDGTGVWVAILDTGLLPTWRSYFPDGADCRRVRRSVRRRRQRSWQRAPGTRQMGAGRPLAWYPRDQHRYRIQPRTELRSTGGPEGYDYPGEGS